MFRRHLSFGAHCAIALLFAAGSRASANPVIIDGNLSSDWGITVADNNGSNYGVANPSTGVRTVGGFTYSYQVEDQSDSAGLGAFLGPNYGGQKYDAEFLGAGVNGTNFVIAIVTGQRPDDGFSNYSPGDIRIGTSSGTIGVEVGGGAGHTGGAASAAITEGALGATYKLDGNGFTVGVLSSSGSSSGNVTGLVTSSSQTAGSVWLNPTWIPDPIPNPTTLTQFQFTGGTLLGLSDFIYTRDSVTGQHAIIEVAIPLSYFGGATITSVAWSPACGNDLLDVGFPSGALPTPEPASVGLLLMGGIGLALLRRAQRCPA